MRQILTLFISACLLYSCSSNSEEKCEKMSFNQAFPKRSQNITKQFGENVKALRFNSKAESDTVSLRFFFNRETRENIIIDQSEENDTLFKGFVSYYRGYYFMSERINDTTFYIGMLNREADTLFGLGQVRSQMCKLYTLFTNEATEEIYKIKQKVVAQYDSVALAYRLSPVKADMKELYKPLLNAYPKYYVLSKQ